MAGITDDLEGHMSVEETYVIVEEMKNVNPSDKRGIISELKRGKTLGVMACGLTGVGKSTLLNGLSGKDVFATGDTEPETFKVESYTKVKDNCKLILYDTPGFDDGLGNEQQYLEEITKECTNVDTLFYCISVNEVRINMKRDLSTLQKLKVALNHQIWGNCVVVLTFANCVVNKIKSKNIHDTDTIKREYDRIIKEWEKKVLEMFAEAGIDPFENQIPIIHAGVYHEPFILKTDQTPWLTVLWRTVHDRSNPDGQAVLFRLSLHRIRLSYRIRRAVLPLRQQEIVVDEDTFRSKLKARFPTIATALTTGGVAGVAGAGIGATIGALAIGIPTFGVAAGVGLLLGGLIGGGVGVGVGAATGKLVEKVTGHGRTRTRK